MSVRRLAEGVLQPPSFAFSADNARWAERRIGLYPEGRQQSAVIPLLMRAQNQEGWITRAAIEAIARMLGMPYIRVLEVATFYTQFQLKPVGNRAHVQLCGTTPCMLRGAEDLRDVLQERIHHDPLALNPDGTLSWEEVECLGACVNAPMIAIGADTYEDLTPARLGEIVDAFARGDGASVPAGPQNGRQSSEPEGGRVTLVEVATAEREAYAPPPSEAPAAVAAPSAPQEPTTKGRPRDVQEEGAPAIKGPSPDAKVSEGKAEGERLRTDAAANANGEPNRAMREDATGAETPAAKIDGGKTTGRRKRGGAAEGAAGGGVGTRARKGRAASQGARADVDPNAPGGDVAPAGGATQTRTDTDTSPPTREIGGTQSDDGKEG